NFASDIFDTEVLFDDPHFVVAGAGSRWAQRHKIAIAELSNEPWIIPPSPVLETLLKEMFETEGLKPPSRRVIAGSVILRMHLLATGRFLSLFPKSVFGPPRSNGRSRCCRLICAPKRNPSPS